MNSKQKSEKEKQANKVLYITVAAMLIVMAAIVMLSSMFSRSNTPADSDSQNSGTDTQTQSQSDTEQTPSSTPSDNTQSNIPSVSLPVAADPTPDPVIPQTPTEDIAPTLSLPLDGALSKEFSDKTLVYSSTMEDYRTHMGIDINAALGDTVRAAATGRITDVWYDPMMGQCIKIEHNGGLETVYRNVSETLCEGIGIGSSVLEGDAIGYVGETAMIEIAQEPHLHFEVLKDGAYVDPTEHMSSAALSRLLEDTGYEG